MAFYSRADRIGLKIQKAITDLMQKKIQDPRLEMVTVSNVKMSPDLRVAFIYVTTYSREIKKSQVLEGCKRSGGFMKKHIGSGLGLKYMPEFRFIYDDSFDKAAKMDALISSVVDPLAKEDKDVSQDNVGNLDHQNRD